MTPFLFFSHLHADWMLIMDYATKKYDNKSCCQILTRWEEVSSSLLSSSFSFTSSAPVISISLSATILTDSTATGTPSCEAWRLSPYTVHKQYNTSCSSQQLLSQMVIMWDHFHLSPLWCIKARKQQLETDSTKMNIMKGLCVYVCRSAADSNISC